MRIVGVDHGDRNIGLAVSDPLGLTAQPLGAERVGDRNGEVQAVVRAVATMEAGKVVVGLPRSLNGTLGPRAQIVLSFVEALKGALTIPVETWDERLSTREADRVLASAGVKPSKRKEKIDTICAQIILQSYLDAHRS
jgi:putative holliday junction resolvase